MSQFITRFYTQKQFYRCGLPLALSGFSPSLKIEVWCHSPRRQLFRVYIWQWNVGMVIKLGISHWILSKSLTLTKLTLCNRIFVDWTLFDRDMDNLNEVDSTEWRFDKLISATTYSVRYMAKLGQIALEEASITEVTTQARITENERIVCVKEPEIPKCSFQDLPVSLYFIFHILYFRVYLDPSKFFIIFYIYSSLYNLRNQI